MDAVEELPFGPRYCQACAYWGSMQTRPLCPAHNKRLAEIDRSHPQHDVVYVEETGKFFLVVKNIKELPAPGGSKDGSGSGDIDPGGEWFRLHRAITVDHPGPLSERDIIRLLKARSQKEKLDLEENS